MLLKHIFEMSQISKNNMSRTGELTNKNVGLDVTLSLIFVEIMIFY